MIFAMYSIRSKQEYIYRTNKVVEIVGGSENISKAWDYLFEQAVRSAGLKVLRILEDSRDMFCMNDVKEEFAKEQLDMVELFRGGGNDHIMFRDKECFIKANKAFSFYLLENFPGMIPMAVSCEVTGDYRKDYKTLMERADVEKNKMIPGRDTFILPFSMMDRVTLQPITDIKCFKYVEETTKENLSKRKAGIECRNKDKSIKILDDMVTKRGEESLLAVVHADGNNMGSKIMELLGEKTDYDYCISAMRRFTRETANAFVNKGLEAMKECQKNLIEKYKNKNLKESAFVFRKIIADGDDMTFICNARFVMDYVKSYIDAVRNYQKETDSEWQYSSCAGICIFHSHFSFAQAYHLAEEACDDGAKKMVHCVDEMGRLLNVEESWVDFHYIHSGVSGNLLSIREQQGTNSCMARPWRLDDESDTIEQSYSKLEELAKIFKECKIARNDIKKLGVEWETSKQDAYASLNRIYGHHEKYDLEKRVKQLELSGETLMKAIYDLAEVYDLWYQEV